MAARRPVDPRSVPAGPHAATLRGITFKPARKSQRAGSEAAKEVPPKRHRAQPVVPGDGTGAETAGSAGISASAS